MDYETAYNNAVEVINAAAKARRLPQSDARAAIEAARRLFDATIVYNRRRRTLGVNDHETIDARHEVSAALDGWINATYWLTSAEKQAVTFGTGKLA